jgi:hypothetical protein
MGLGAGRRRRGAWSRCGSGWWCFAQPGECELLVLRPCWKRDSHGAMAINSGEGDHTSVVKAVFPPPLGPTSRNVGSVAAAAAFL